ncbi:MAG: electron transport complex subunit RsxG [Gammaproteobacteria bacterium]|nr:electron transport complex subunit RsxG [Gammaproteobacteria bacterium]
MMRNIAIGGVLLALFAMVGTGLVSATYLLTKDQIAENEKQRLLGSINALLPASAYDNAIEQDLIFIRDPIISGKEEIPVYRARNGEEDVAAIIGAIAPDGYAGPIKLLIGIRVSGEITGVRVISHHETPGLGDAIEIDRSDWLLSFIGKSLSSLTEAEWAVKKDGGVFDQFTGATITPRIVVKSVHNTLLYFQKNRKRLFESPAYQGEAT